MSPVIRQLADLRRHLAALGARPCHTERLLRAWAQGWPLDRGRGAAADFFPAGLQAELPALTAQLGQVVRLCAQHAGEEGAVRLLLALSDEHTIESVLLPRAAVCVSTQVGCAVGCLFCMTGRAGLLRQLGSAEIVAQVVLARQQRPIKKVVFMGMGEPAHNLENVMDAIELLGTLGGIGHKSLVFSSVGDRRIFARLPQGTVKPALALSLHSTDPALRARLLPHAQAIDPAELVALGEAYARATGYPIQYQWTLLAGVNDSDAELDGIVRLLKGKYAVMNFILYNDIDGTPFTRTDSARAAAMSWHLYRHGILAKLRQSAGQDVAGGCGQLRARSSKIMAQGEGGKIVGVAAIT